ncbi:serine-rich adhesin for platelets [Filimonas sp.]|nr:serine-rich adhesin for platelets [Filimonas sp.]
MDLTSTGAGYKLGIWDATGPGGTPGTNLWTSASFTSVPGTAFIPVPNIPVSGDYFVGVRQTTATNVGFAYQTENPIRTGTFYYTSPMGNTVWSDFATASAPYRFSIEVQVRIPVPPNCAINFAPSDASSVTCSTPVLSWQGGGGAPTGYDVYFSANQTDVTNMVPAALVSSNQAGTSYTPAGLAANATYYWKVIPRNADGPALGCSVQSFTTGSLPNCYCIPVYTGTLCTGGISNVTFNTISNSAACAPPAHAVYSPTGALTTTVGQNGVYNLSVTTTDACIISAWIDYNQNGIIDTTEWSQVTTASVANTASTIAINIPSTALLGNTLMRVRSRLANNANFGSNACTPFGSGSSQDYVITIVPPIPCSGTPNPGNTLSSASTVCSGGTINFSLQNPTAGVGVSYQWQNLNGNITGATNTTYSQIITGYDEIKCEVTCAGSTGTSVEAIVDISSFIGCYCAAGATTGCTAGDEYIGNVTFNTINNSSACANTYTDYTSISTSVTQAQTYAASVLIPNYFAGDQAAIWIDFNHDGVFNTTNEQFILSGTGASATVPFTTNIQIPITSLTGLTRMRVRGTYTGTMSPCGNAAWGEVEDYFIDIVAAPVCAGTPTPGTTTASTNTLCGSGTVTFSLAGQATLIGSGITYQWMKSSTGAISGATNQTYTATVNTTDQYFCMVSCNGGTAVSSAPSASVIVNSLPTVTAASSAPAFCAGSPALVLTASGSAATYAWTPAAGLSATTGSPVSASPSSATTYVVTATDGNGCSASSSVAVPVYQPPTVSTTPSATSACPGDSIQFTTTASSILNGSLLTTLIAGNGSSGNAFNLIAANTVTVTGFKMQITAGTMLKYGIKQEGMVMPT